MPGKVTILSSLIAALFLATAGAADARPAWVTFVSLPGNVHGLTMPEASPYPEPEIEPMREELSREELCEALVAAARERRLPISFFTNLIWQESRFVPDAVSPAGAQGVAQFMPAVSKVMDFDPYDPREAIPAAAELLRVLVDRFGNLGLAAAAYNAGPLRVREWLEKRGALPTETRNYVAIITGRQADHWRTRRESPDGFVMPARVPCHRVAEFAEATRDEQKLAVAALAAEAAEARATAEREAAKSKIAKTSAKNRTAKKSGAKSRLAKAPAPKSRTAKSAVDKAAVKSRTAKTRDAKRRSAKNRRAVAATSRGRGKARPATVRSARRKDGPLG